MENPELHLFDNQLLTSLDNPFKYPHPPHRAPFIVGCDRVIEWLKTRFRESIGQGSKISFIIGVPGAGKSHLLSHLEYMFYESRAFKGIYAVYNARSEEIDEKDLWINLFWSEGVLDTLKQIIDSEKIRYSKVRPDSRSNLEKLFEGNLQVDTLDVKSLHNMAEGLSKLLVEQNAGICLAIDNIDEYFRSMTEKYEKQYGKEEARNRVAANLLGTIRVATAGLDQIVVLLACTEDVHNQIMQARVDVTYGRRVEDQQRKIGELTPHQSLGLVYTYLAWWAHRQGIKLPTVDDEECMFFLPTGEKLSIYPFSVKAIEYFHKVTRSISGDIVCLCGQCINDIRRMGTVSVVRGAAIPFALEEAKKAYPQLVLRLDILEKERPLYMKDLMERRLDIIQREMKGPGSDSARIVNAIEKYSDELGVRKISVSPACDYRDNTRSLPLNENSRVWEYRNRKILVKYIIGPHQPIGPQGREFGYGKRIETQDRIEAISYLDDDKVTHVLFVRRWANTFWDSTLHMSEVHPRLRSVIEEFNVDDAIGKIVAATEDTSEHHKDLVLHVEKFHANLLPTLNNLVEKRIPEESLEERRRRDRDAMAKGIS